MMTNINEIILNNILTAMQKQSVNQVELAMRANICEQNLVKMFSGDALINSGDLTTVAKALKTTVGELARLPDCGTEKKVIRVFIDEVNSEEAKRGLEIADEIADLICFHSKCRKNGEIMLQSYET